MAFANSGDPSINPKEGGFENEEFPKGTYTLTGIEDFFPLDDNELPSFKAVQNDVKAHCHFSTKETLNRQPAWSGSAVDYLQLAKALGADVEDLEPASTTEFLFEIQKRINQVKPSSQIYVRESGWVSTINVLLPPTGFYRIFFDYGKSLDGTEPITFQEKKNYIDPDHPLSVVRFIFRIVSDVDGDETYAGTPVIVDVQDPFEGVFKNMPSWKRAKNGGMLIGQKRLMTFLNIFWPEVEDYQWITDPEKSIYGIDEAQNPIEVIVNKASESAAQAMTRLEVTEKGFIKMDLQDLSPCKSQSPVSVKPKVQVTPPWEDEPKQTQIHLGLIKAVNDLAFEDIGGPAIVQQTGNPYALTAEGVKWCKKVLAPACENLGIPRSFSKLTRAQAKQLEAVLVADHSDESDEQGDF